VIVKIVTEILFWQCAFDEAMKQPSWQQITDAVALRRKDRDLDHACNGVGIEPESGEVLTHHHHMFNKTDTTCQQIRMGMVAYLGGV